MPSQPRTAEQRERRNQQERERRRSDPEWVERVNACRRERLMERRRTDPEWQEAENARRRSSRPRGRPRKVDKAPRSSSEMVTGVESALVSGGWVWVPDGTATAPRRGQPSPPPMFATHPVTRRTVWLEVRTSPQSDPARADTREALESADVGCHVVFPANVVSVCGWLRDEGDTPRPGA